MALFEVEADGRRFQVEADSMGRAQGMARLYIARNRMLQQAEEGAQARSVAPAPSVSEPTIPEARLTPTQELARARMGAAEKMPGESAAIGLAATGAAAFPGIAAGYVAGQALEKIPGVPPWAGEAALTAAGLASPGRKVLQWGLGKLAAATAKEAPKIVAREAAEAGIKLTAREAEQLALKRKALEIAERRVAVMEQRLTRQAGQRAGTVVPMTQPVPAVTPSVAGPVAVPASTGIPVPAADLNTIVLKLQQEMRTPGGKKVVRELLDQMPKDQASRVRLLLARGQAHPATTANGGARAAQTTIARTPEQEAAWLRLQELLAGQ